MKQLSPSQAASLQLAPGLANLVVFTLFALWFSTIGVPPLLALAASVLIGEVPVSWWIMRRITRRETGGVFDLTVTFPWRTANPWWQYLLIGLPLVGYGVIMVSMVTPALGAVIRDFLDISVPAWFLLEPDPGMFARLDQGDLVALWLSSLLIFAGVGGITQELYSRGFLLPRTQSLGWLAPLFNATFFAVLHLNAPWSWPGFFLLSLPWAYLTWWKRSVKFGLLGHVGMLLMQTFMMALLVFGLVPAERMTG